jgi:hypothetical protein
MADVFVLYSSYDWIVAQSAIKALAGEGLELDWDSGIRAGGKEFTSLRNSLVHSRIALVIWSANFEAASLLSDFAYDLKSKEVASALMVLQVDSHKLPDQFSFGGAGGSATVVSPDRIASHARLICERQKLESTTRLDKTFPPSASAEFKRAGAAPTINDGPSIRQQLNVQSAHDRFRNGLFMIFVGVGMIFMMYYPSFPTLDDLKVVSDFRVWCIGGVFLFAMIDFTIAIHDYLSK